MAREQGRPKHVAITGASSGIGAQLALLYAGRNVQLSLLARNGARLEEIAQQCRDRGAEVACALIDTRDSEAVSDWFDEVDGMLAVDLLIANAGIFDGHGPDDALETAHEAREIIEINALGTIYTIQAALQPMRARRHGHIVVISSLAALLPAADAPTYAASKAATLAYCDAIRLLLMPDNVRVSVVLPGHVETPQTELHVGSLAMMVTAQEAAVTIKRRLERGHIFIAFPQMAYWLVRLVRLMPWPVRERLLRHDRFHVRKDVR